MTVAVKPLPAPDTAAKPPRVIAIASGKGGVGKTWLAITLAHTLAKRGRRVLLFDGDLGLANVDIQLGLMPERDLGGVLAGRLSLKDARISFGGGGFDIIAGRSGSERLANIAPTRLHGLSSELTDLRGDYDMIILDLGAGVERTVRHLTGIVDACLVVATDEPTSLTDAYAFIKLTRAERPALYIGVVVNQASSVKEGERTYGALLKACEGFLRFTPPLFGIVRRDAKVREAIRTQTPLLTRHPTADAVADVAAVVARLGQPMTASAC